MTANSTEQATGAGGSDLLHTTTPKAAVILTSQQLAMIRALDNRDITLSAMYRGALAALLDTSNPDRFAQSAHSIRELMEKLPEQLDVPMKAQKESLKVKIREIEDVYLNVQKKTGCFSVSNGWDGNIDVHLRRLLKLVDSFFEWFASHHPRRRDELHGVLVRLEASGRALPKPLASLNVDAWDRKRDYFQTVAHHRRDTDEQEFLQWLDALERFLLDRFVPRTFDDFSEIDALLMEGGKNA